MKIKDSRWRVDRLTELEGQLIAGSRPNCAGPNGLNSLRSSPGMQCPFGAATEGNRCNNHFRSPSLLRPCVHDGKDHDLSFRGLLMRQCPMVDANARGNNLAKCVFRNAFRAERFIRSRASGQENRNQSEHSNTSKLHILNRSTIARDSSVPGPDRPRKTSSGDNRVSDGAHSRDLGK